jgi:hypothetical protein
VWSLCNPERGFGDDAIFIGIGSMLIQEKFAGDNDCTGQRPAGSKNQAENREGAAGSRQQAAGRK